MVTRVTGPSTLNPAAVVFGCAGPTLSRDEADFFRRANPLGFILFARNCQTPDQVAALVAALRGAVGRADAPVLIDQEGGRVARLRPPHWRHAPSARTFAKIAKDDPARAVAAARLNARLMGQELFDLGITVDCAPVLDIPQPGADPIIGDRAHGQDIETIALLGTAVCEGLIESAVTPVIKHIPGHGRATVDSHKDLPVVDTPLDRLAATDFPPFGALAAQPWGGDLWAMTAHVVYTAIDAAAPATLSADVIDRVIRTTIGFDGLLVSDDLSMEALRGDFKHRAAQALAAGCDVVLHCNGRMEEMIAVSEGTSPMNDPAMRRFTTAEMARKAANPAHDNFDRAQAEDHLAHLLTGAG